ncbi:NADPH:quinone oxidoreductase family protein [Xanthobacter pseudotagetidis]|uniref:NADPH:quinone oxidoreductase family protein n=1 Tax=Xanthobacter pseudotagetidis TaxID=3119911 RepID=UPI0037288B0A
MSTPDTMDALVCAAHGEPSGLAVAPAPVPVPKKGQVLIAVEAAGISYVDVLMARNAHQNKHEVPFSPGMEVAGRIAALGPDTAGFTLGQSVAALVYDGGHAPFVAASVSETFALPEGCDPVRTAGLLSVALTADLALVERARLEPGESVLVGGAAGGVGICAVQFARHMGARVIAATSSEERNAVAMTAGAHAALTYGEAFRERFQALNDGRDADVIVDPVGGVFADGAANLLDWDGRYVVIGFAGGAVPSFAANRLLVKNRAVLGMVLGYYRWQKPQVLAKSAERVLSAIAAGALDGPLTIVDGLGAVPGILGRIAARQQLGKAVVRL